MIEGHSKCVKFECDKEDEHPHRLPGASYCHADHECGAGRTLYDHDKCSNTRDCANWLGVRSQHQHFEYRGGQWQWGDCHDVDPDRGNVCGQHYCVDLARLFFHYPPKYAVGAVCHDLGQEAISWLTGRGAAKKVTKEVAEGGAKGMIAVVNLFQRGDDIPDSVAKRIGDATGNVVEGVTSIGLAPTCKHLLDPDDDEEPTICLTYDHTMSGCDGKTAVVVVDLLSDTGTDDGRPVGLRDAITAVGAPSGLSLTADDTDTDDTESVEPVSVSISSVSCVKSGSEWVVSVSWETGQGLRTSVAVSESRTGGHYADTLSVGESSETFDVPRWGTYTVLVLVRAEDQSVLRDRTSVRCPY